MGGTKNLHIEKIKELAPDLIIANKEENVQDQVEEVGKHFPVWVSDINTLQDAIEMINSICIITGKESKAEELTGRITNEFSLLRKSFESIGNDNRNNNFLTVSDFTLQTITHQLKTCYLIWKDPYMTIGGDTFINDMLTNAGFKNIFSYKNRYPEITIKEIQDQDCELLLLSSEPYPFKQQHIEELKTLFPHSKILLVDGEMFSWYGSRLLLAPQYFLQLHKQVLSNS